MSIRKLNNIGKKQINHYLFFIFILGLTNALYQIAIIKHLSIGSPFSSITLIVNVIISLTLFSLGIGAYLSKFVNRSKMNWIAGLSALSVLIVFVFLLKFLPLLSFDQPLAIFYIVVLLSLPMILMGILIAKVYQIFVEHKKKIGQLVFWHTIGFALGQVAAYAFIKFIGANLLFFVIFFIFFAFYFKKKIFIPFIVAVVIALFFIPIDAKLESFRNREMLLWPNTSTANHLHSAWSPYAKIDVFVFDDCIAGVYNYGQQWMTCQDKTKDFEIRSELYPELKGKILLIGAGGGMGLSQFDDEQDVTGVELDPVVVDIMKNKFSKYNNNSYNKFNVLNADGREFLESTTDKYDYIIYEGVDYTFATKSKNFIEVENYLYTEEGIALALKALKKNGAMLLIQTSGVTPMSRTIEAIPEGYLVDLREYLLNKPIPFGGFILTVSKDIFTFNNLKEIYKEHSDIFYEFDSQLPITEKITDNNPFLYINNQINISSLIYYALALFVLIFLLLLFLPLRNRSSKLYFFLLGIAMIVSELFFITELRSLFGGYILTFIIFSLIFFAGYSIGNYYFDRFKKYINFTPLILILALWLVQFIPWGSHTLIKLLFSIFLLLPPALFLGMFFPLALSKIKAKEVPFVYMIDSLGVALGFFLFYLTSILFGFIFSFILVILLYVILLILLRKFKY